MSNRRRSRAVGLAADVSGSAAVEFALVSPLLILLLVGAIQLGWVVHCAASVRWALEASARSLMINPSLTSDQLRTAMVSKLSGVAKAADVEVTITPDEADESLVVESTYNAELGIPLIPVKSLTFHNRVTVPTLGAGS